MVHAPSDPLGGERPERPAAPMLTTCLPSGRELPVSRPQRWFSSGAASDQRNIPSSSTVSAARISSGGGAQGCARVCSIAYSLGRPKRRALERLRPRFPLVLQTRFAKPPLKQPFPIEARFALAALEITEPLGLIAASDASALLRTHCRLQRYAATNAGRPIAGAEMRPGRAFRVRAPRSTTVPAAVTMRVRCEARQGPN